VLALLPLIPSGNSANTEVNSKEKKREARRRDDKWKEKRGRNREVEISNEKKGRKEWM
jgi:hypothetical protein